MPLADTLLPAPEAPKSRSRGAYTAAGQRRELREYRHHGRSRLVDMPAPGVDGVIYPVEDDVPSDEVAAIVNDYRAQAARLDEIPARACA